MVFFQAEADTVSCGMHSGSSGSALWSCCFGTGSGKESGTFGGRNSGGEKAGSFYLTQAGGI